MLTRRLKGFFARARHLTDAEIALVSGVRFVISAQLLLAQKKMGDVIDDPWVAGYFFGLVMSLLEFQRFDIGNEKARHQMFAMAAVAACKSRSDAKRLLQVAGAVAGTELSDQGVRAAKADFSAWTTTEAGPARLMSWCAGRTEIP